LKIGWRHKSTFIDDFFLILLLWYLSVIHVLFVEEKGTALSFCRYRLRRRTFLIKKILINRLENNKRMLARPYFHWSFSWKPFVQIHPSSFSVQRIQIKTWNSILRFVFWGTSSRLLSKESKNRAFLHCLLFFLFVC